MILHFRNQDSSKTNFGIAEEQHAPAFIRKVELHFFDGKKFWKRQTLYDDRVSFRLFRVLKLFHALNEFLSVCKFCCFCRCRDEAGQSRIPITNEVGEKIVLNLVSSTTRFRFFICFSFKPKNIYYQTTI